MGLRKELEKEANPKRAAVLQRFFRTGKGEYAEGDRFLGITVPKTREIAKQFSGMGFSEIKNHLLSEFHEERLAALLVLVEKFRKGNEQEKKKVFDFFLANTKNVNNWDLVDLTADKIVGSYLLDRNKKILFKLAESENIWKRRIAVVATFAFIKNNRLEETFSIVQKMLADKQDLIHKACGWMLRETGKKDSTALEHFLEKHSKEMPRTMLRYAIERMPETKRKRLLTKQKNKTYT